MKSVGVIKTCLLLVFLASAAMAQETTNFIQSLRSQLPVRFATSRFMEPNELFPQDAKEILKNAKSGVHLAVGTERAFFGAALNENSTQMLAIDSSGGNIAYNQINIMLLTIAENRKDFVKLKSKTSYKELIKRMAASPELADHYSQMLAELNLDAGTWNKWQKLQRSSSSLSYMYSKTGPGAPYAGANYHLEDKAFQKLHQMAKAGKMNAIAVDLNETKHLSKIQSVFKKHSARIGVLDISNAWMTQAANGQAYQYIKSLPSLFDNLKDTTSNDSILLISGELNESEAKLAMQARKTIHHPWIYAGFNFKYLNQFPSYLHFKDFLDNHFLLADSRTIQPYYGYRDASGRAKRKAPRSFHGLLHDIPGIPSNCVNTIYTAFPALKDRKVKITNLTRYLQKANTDRKVASRNIFKLCQSYLDGLSGRKLELSARLLYQRNSASPMSEVIVITHQQKSNQAQTASHLRRNEAFKNVPRFTLSSSGYPVVDPDLLEESSILLFSEEGYFDWVKVPLAEKVHLFGGWCEQCLKRSMKAIAENAQKQGLQHIEFVLHDEYTYLGNNTRFGANLKLDDMYHCKQAFRSLVPKKAFIANTYSSLGKGWVNKSMKAITNGFTFKATNGFSYSVRSSK